MAPARSCWVSWFTNETFIKPDINMFYMEFFLTDLLCVRLCVFSFWVVLQLDCGREHLVFVFSDNMCVPLDGKLSAILELIYIVMRIRVGRQMTKGPGLF